MHGTDYSGRGIGGSEKVIMKILLLATHLNFGGIGSYVLNLARGLEKKGNTVFVASSGGDLVSRLLSEGIEHIDLNIKTKSELSPKIIFSFLKLRRLIRQRDIGIIHSQTRVTQVLSWFLSRSLSVPFVTTCHGYFKVRMGRRIFACWGERVIAISEAVKRHLLNDFGLRPDRVRLVYNGIEVGTASPAPEGPAGYPKEQIRKRLGLRDGPVIGIIARLSGVKGHKYLVEAMKDVISSEPGAQLLIAGDGPFKDALTNLIDKTGIRNNTVLIPSAENTGELFSLMSVYVSPSLKEGLGLSILEAQANYVPVVAFRTGGICDVIENEVTGLLAEPFDTKMLASYILRLLRDKALSLRLKQAAYKLVKEKFSLEAMAENTLRVYEEVCIK